MFVWNRFKARSCLVSDSATFAAAARSMASVSEYDSCYEDDMRQRNTRPGGIG